MLAAPRTPRAGRTKTLAEPDTVKVGEAELADIFRKFDHDGSGSIDARELHQAMKMLGVSCTFNSARKILAEIDTDNNGTVEWEEFQTFFDKVGSPEGVKLMLSKQNQRFFEYKQTVESDPSFAKTFAIPPMVSAAKKFEGHNESVESVCWLSDDTLISGSIDGEVLTWNAVDKAKRPKPLRRMKVGGGAALYSMALACDSDKLVVGLGREEKNLNLWSLAGGAALTSYEGHTAPVYSCGFSADGVVVASGSKSGALCVHYTAMEACTFSVQAHTSVVHSVAVRGNSGTVCTASKDGAVKIWDSRNPNPQTKADIVLEDAAAAGTVHQALWRGDLEILSCGDDYCIKRWDIRAAGRGPTSSYFGHTSVVRSITLSEDKHFMVSGTYSGSVRVWHVDEAGVLKDALREAKEELDRCQATRDDKVDQFEAGQLDVDQLKASHELVGTWEAKVGQITQSYRQLQAQGYTQAFLGCDGPILPVSSLAWRDDGRDQVRVAVGSQDQAVRIFKLDLAKALAMDL